MLTNFNTVVKSIKKLKDMDADIESGVVDKMIKKSALDFTREHQKLIYPLVVLRSWILFLTVYLL